MPAAFYGLFAEASVTNPTGNKVCVEIANPNCGSENDLKGGLTKIIGDMLKNTQQSEVTSEHSMSVRSMENSTVTLTLAWSMLTSSSSHQEFCF